MTIRILVAGPYLDKSLRAVKRNVGDLHDGPDWNEADCILSGLAERVAPEPVAPPEPEPSGDIGTQADSDLPAAPLIAEPSVVYAFDGLGLKHRQQEQLRSLGIASEADLRAMLEAGGLVDAEIGLSAANKIRKALGMEAG